MRTTRILWLFLGLGWSLALAAGSIEVNGTGSAWAHPDQVRVELGWSGVDPTVRGAIGAAEDAIRAVTQALLTAGVAPEDVRTSGYYLWREERWDESGSPQLIGYRVTHTLQVVLRLVDTLALVLDGASSAGANQIGGVSFHVAARGELERSARAQAFAVAAGRAAELADLAGLELSMATRIVERTPFDAFASPQAFAMARSEGAGGGFAAGQQAVEVTLEITFATHPRATR